MVVRNSRGIILEESCFFVVVVVFLHSANSSCLFHLQPVPMVAHELAVETDDVTTSYSFYTTD